MGIDNYNLPFNLHTTQQMPLRNRPDRYAQSKLAERFRFEVSEGVRPAEFMGSYKYLPVLQKDITTEDYIVLPKGRLVSSVTSEDSLPAGNMENPASSGSLYSFESQTTDLFVQRGIDTSRFGYDEYITNLIVPANNGISTDLWYTANDVAAETITSSGTYAAAGDGFALPANYPIGALFHDWYQDIRGKYLNYKMWPDGGHVLCDWYVEVPYVKVHDGGGTNYLGSGVTPVSDNTYANWSDAARFAINDRFTYLTVNTDVDTFMPGVFVTPQSDGTGNYKLQDPAAGNTIHTAGRLIGIDNRFPKSGLEDVLTYPGSQMPGSQTAGLPSFLFEFVMAVQSLTGTPPSVEEVVGMVQEGYYGVARINLTVA